MLQVIYTDSSRNCTLEIGFVELSAEQHVWIAISSPNFKICHLRSEWDLI